MPGPAAIQPVHRRPHSLRKTPVVRSRPSRPSRVTSARQNAFAASRLLRSPAPPIRLHHPQNPPRHLPQAPRPPPSPLQSRHRFLQALRDGKHISPSRLADLLSWKHSGFNIHDGGEKPVPSHDADGRKRLAEYLLRHPFSLQKITWNPTTQTVIYRSKRHHTTKRNFEIFKAPDFIAAVIDHPASCLILVPDSLIR